MDQLYDDFEQYIDMDNTKDKYNTITKSNIVIINSKDRDYNLYSNYNFCINFNSNSKFLNINKTFKNIVSIEFLYLIIPNIYVDIIEGLSLFNKQIIKYSDNPINLMRIGDLPYLLLNISEIKNNESFGSNNQINKSCFILKLDDKHDRTYSNGGTTTISGDTFTSNGNLNNGIVATNEKKILYYKDIGCTPIIFHSSPQSYLNNLEISLMTPEGKLLSNLNNCLDCSTITSIGNDTDGDPFKINIVFTQYFCGDEYNIGDKIIFKDILFGNNDNSDLVNFLLKEDGHTILEHGGKGSGSLSKIYSQITIVPEYTIDLNKSANSVGKSDIKNKFDLDTLGTLDFTEGKVFNLSLQITFGLKINTEERNESKLHSHIN
jgi:hypothetical protein